MPEMLPREHKLENENGLRIFTLSTPGFKTGRISVQVNAGSAYDPKDYEGTAHYLEHMMFNGSILNPDKNKTVDMVSEWGGDFNAMTSMLHTKYYTSDAVLAEHLDDTVNTALDMVQHPNLRSSEVERERGVILREMADRHNNAGRALVAEAHFRRAADGGWSDSDAGLTGMGGQSVVEAESRGAARQQHRVRHKHQKRGGGRGFGQNRQVHDD